MSDWIKIKDKQPNINRTVIFSQSGFVFTGRREQNCYWNWQSMDYCEPEYWMPLPDAPEDK